MKKKFVQIVTLLAGRKEGKCGVTKPAFFTVGTREIQVQVGTILNCQHPWSLETEQNNIL